MAMACSRGSGNRSTCVGSGCDLLIVLVVIGLSEISLWIIAREKGLQRSLMRFIISADVPISTYPLQMRLLLFNSELSEMPPENAVLFDLSGQVGDRESSLRRCPPGRTCYNFGSLESGSSTTSPWSSFLSERGFVRQLNSSSRFRISSADVSRALQCSQSGLWILRRTNR